MFLLVTWTVGLTHSSTAVVCMLLQNCFGTARAVSVLRGSKAKSIEPWMQDIKDQHGNPLHGAGSSRSDDWWKGLAGVLMGQGYLQSQHKSVSAVWAAPATAVIAECT